MHVSVPALENLPWYLRPFFRRQRRRYGAPLAPALVWARLPRLYLALLAFNAAVNHRRSPLPPVLRSLVQIRISQINHCDFCVDLNASIAAERAGSTDKAFAVSDWRGSALFDERERVALEYAEAITTTGATVEEPLLQRLRGHFDEQALIELTALVAFQNLSSKFNAALAIPAQGLCELPRRPASTPPVDAQEPPR